LHLLEYGGKTIIKPCILKSTQQHVVSQSACTPFGPGRSALLVGVMSALRGPAWDGAGAGPEEDGERPAGETKANQASSFDEPGAPSKSLKAMKRTTFSMRSLRESWGPSDRGKASDENAVCAPLAYSSASITHHIVSLQLRKIQPVRLSLLAFLSSHASSSLLSLPHL
jgi:hypothetical protein